MMRSPVPPHQCRVAEPHEAGVVPRITMTELLLVLERNLREDDRRER